MGDTACNIYLIRHGESVANLEKINQGHFDSPLTEHGKEQARTVAHKLRDVAFSSIYSSDLRRALATADIIRGDRDVPIKTSASLRERSFGSLEGLPQNEYRALISDELDNFDSLAPEDKWSCMIHPEIETDKSVYERFATYLQDLLSDCEVKNLLVVSHRGPTRLLLIKLDYFSYESLDAKKALGNAGYVQLTYQNGELSVRELYKLEE